MIKIACNFVPDYVVKARKMLESFAKVDYVEWDYKKILNNIAKYDVFIPDLSTYLDCKVFKNANRLKLIATPSTGTNHIDIQAAESNGVTVMSIKNDIAVLKRITSTAELALGLMLATIRSIPAAFDSVKSGEWDRNSFIGHTLSEKVLGVIGYGRLGEMMARYGDALGMKVLATDPYKNIDVNYIEQVSYEELLKVSDVISIHVHLNNETEGMISEKQLNMMKNGAVIVNTSRGSITDETALIKALETGKLGGVGVDVLTDELAGNINDIPLLQYAKNHKNVVVTPHIGGATFESQQRAYLHLSKKIKEWISI